MGNISNHTFEVTNFGIYHLDYIYKEFASVPKDVLTELHLRYFKSNKNPQKKILGYWDFNQRVSRLGDFLGFLEYLTILRYEFNLKGEKNIDLCFIDDDKHYNHQMSKFSKTYLFKKQMKNITITNTHVDSVYYFKSNAEFNRFYIQNKKRYVRWPPTVAGSLIFDFRKIENFYAKQGFIPSLNIPPEILGKMSDFYAQKVYPAKPIVINVRQNDHSQQRNTSSSELFNFLKKYESNENYKFIIICNKEEIPLHLRKLHNVIFSKDYFTDIEYDLALIKIAHLAIFPSSGMACFAWFAKVPFIQHGPHGRDKYTRPKTGGYSFFNKYQRHFDNSMTAEWLASEFGRLLQDLHQDGIDNTAAVLSEYGEKINV